MAENLYGLRNMKIKCPHCNKEFELVIPVCECLDKLWDNEEDEVWNEE